MGISLTTALIGLAVFFVSFIILREFYCWYWKINQINSLLESQNDTLLQILKYIEKEEIHKSKIRFPAATHIAIEDVRLRSEPDMSTAPLRILDKGELVVFLEKGATVENANLVSAPWFYVKTEGGEQGWVFSGSLKNV